MPKQNKIWSRGTAKFLARSCLVFVCALFIVHSLPFGGQNSLAIVNAQTQLEYPELPGGVQPPSGTGAELFISLVRYLYQALLVSGVILAVGFVIYAGVLYLSSFGKPFLLKKAKEIISAAVWGLLILFASYTVLVTIDPSFVVLDLNPVVFPSFPRLGSYVVTSPPEPELCQEIPVQKTFLAIHDLEKEALRVAERIKPIILGDAAKNIPPMAELAKNISDKIQECSCLKFTDPLCLVAGSGSAACPALCPAASQHPPSPGGSEDPCPAELRQVTIPAMDERIGGAKEIIALLDSWNLFAGLGPEQRLEIAEQIRAWLEQELPGNPISFEDFVRFFTLELERILGRQLDTDQAVRNQRANQIGAAIAKSLGAQVNLLNNITRRLVELRMDFERYKALMAQYRAEEKRGTRQLLSCSQAKDQGLIKGDQQSCNELDFYHCP